MPAPISNPFVAQWRLLAAGLLAVLLGPSAWAADVLVVTDSRHPVQAPAGVRVIELDQATSIEVELAAHLPADAQQAAALVRQRLHDGGEALQRRIGHAYQGVADAWGLGIAMIPAVVVDRRYVVYGEPDVPPPSRASTPTGARSHEHPAGIATPARHRRLVAAERGHVDVRPGHRHHRLVGAVPRLPRIPRGRNLLLAVLHAIRLLGSHLRQGAPLRPRCGGVEL